MPSCRLIAIGLTSLIGISGCGQQSPAVSHLTVHTAPLGVKITGGGHLASWPVRLVGPRGGYAWFQIVADVPRPQASLRITALPLIGRHAPAVRIYRELAVPVTTPSDVVGTSLLGRVPDVLAPATIRAQPTTRLTFLVAISIPRNATPGTNYGLVAIGNGSAPPALETYTLRVSRFTVPANHTLDTWFLVWDRHADQWEQRSGASALYHRLLSQSGIGDGTRSSVGGAIDVGVTASQARSDPTASAAQAARAAATIGPTAYSYAFDEPTWSELWYVRQFGRALTRLAPGVRQLVTSRPHSSLAGYVGAWAMHLHDLTAQARQDAGRGAQLWVYSSCCEHHGDPTLLLDDTATSNISVAVATWLKGARGLLYWGVSVYHVNPYTTASSGWPPADGDGVLLYPGRPLGLPGPLLSLRLALVQQSLQIIDEAAALDRVGRGAAAHSMLQSLVDNHVSGAVWAAAERRLIGQLDAISPRAGP